jgi:hypothetical protein
MFAGFEVCEMLLVIWAPWGSSIGARHIFNHPLGLVLRQLVPPTFCWMDVCGFWGVREAFGGLGALG